MAEFISRSRRARKTKKTRGDILVVDDLPNNLDLLRSLLTKSGYRVRTANNGRLAVRIVEAYPPDLILLDINMPVMNGLDVSRHLKSDPRFESIPIIFVTALDRVSDKVEGFEAGGVDYVVKPFQSEEVLARVENQLEIHRLRRKLEQRNRELERKNREISMSQRKVEMVFNALTEILPGTVLDGKYELERKIGSGGHGAVYEGRHVNLDKKVAIKILQPASRNITPETLERFQLEGISACRIHHPNAVQVLDCGVSNRGIAYLVMELLRGLTVRQFLDRRQTLPLHRAAGICRGVASVLAHADEAGLIHRDVKPENIFLHREQVSGREVVKLVDFGIAKMLDPGPRAQPEYEVSMTDESMHGPGDTGIIGTPHYISPERLMESDDNDISSDIYSLGVTFYEMVSGRRPHQVAGNGLQVLVLICKEDPTDLAEVAPQLPEKVSSFVMGMLHKDPEERPTPEEVVDFFDYWARTGPAEETPMETVNGFTEDTPALNTRPLPEFTYSGDAIEDTLPDLPSLPGTITLEE